MKKLAILLLVALSGCVKDEVTRTYKVLTPIWADKATVLSDISSGPAQSLQNLGKLFIKGNYIYINEVDKGVHIIDNSNPSNPRAIAFISIPGNIDIAVKSNYLYADFYTDMLAIDISDPLNVKVVDTNANVFPERYYGSHFAPDPGKVIIGWNEKMESVTSDIDYTQCPNCFATPGAVRAEDGASKAAHIPGIAGSMSRFVIVDHFLYTVSSSSLLVFDVADPAVPERKAEKFLGWSIETVYPFNDNLFIGSASGMIIYDISNPLEPEAKGTFSHVRACDPVVSDGEHAFVTLRTGNECAGNSNQLDVLEVKDVMHPRLIATYPMNNPFGAALDGDVLFVCDGSDGIKVYDVSDINELKMIHRIKDVEAFDAIPWSQRLMVSTKQGLKQYDYSDINNIRLLSTIHASPTK